MSKVTIPLKEYEKLSQVKKLFDNGAKFVSYNIAGENLDYNEIVELSKEEVINTINQAFEGQIDNLKSYITLQHQNSSRKEMRDWYYKISFFITLALLILSLIF